MCPKPRSSPYTSYTQSHVPTCSVLSMNQHYFLNDDYTRVQEIHVITILKGLFQKGSQHRFFVCFFALHVISYCLTTLRFFYKKITHFKLTLPCPFTFKVHWMVRQGGTVRRASQAKGLKPGSARQLSSLRFPTPEKWTLSCPPRKGVVRSNTLHEACRGGNTRDAM